MSIIERILESVSLHEWFSVQSDIVKFHKGKLSQDIQIDDSLQKCLQYMNDNGLSFLAILN